jgi:hypothetical protein
MGLETLKHLQMVKQFHMSKQLDLFQQPEDLFMNLVINPHEKSSMDPFPTLFGS